MIHGYLYSHHGHYHVHGEFTFDGLAVRMIDGKLPKKLGKVVAAVPPNTPQADVERIKRLGFGEVRAELVGTGRYRA